LAEAALETPSIKPGLELEKDYKSVFKEVWDRFYKIYRGGPMVVRKGNDIYSEAGSDEELTFRQVAQQQ